MVSIRGKVKLKIQVKIPITAIAVCFESNWMISNDLIGKEQNI